MAAAALILVIAFFRIKVEKAATAGVELAGVTTNVVIVILLAVLIYHAIAFAIRAYEEFRQWELSLPNREEGARLRPPPYAVTLASQLEQVSDAMQRILANTGAIRHNNQTVFSKEEADLLNEVVWAAKRYADRFDNFPKIVGWRFWAWDVGVPIVVSLLAIGAAVKILPTGHDLFCM